MSVKLREKKLAKGAVKYYLDIYIDGERSYEFLDIKIEKSDTKSVKKEKKDIANLIRSNRELEYLTQNTNYLPKHLRHINFFDFAESFVTEYKKKDLRMIKATLKHFKSFVDNPKLKLTDVSPSIMNGYKDYLNDTSGLTGESPHNYFTRFKKILKDAEVRGLIRENPTRDIRFQRKTNDDELRKQVLTSEELQKLVDTDCGNSELKKAFLFACYTGLGYAEIKKLKWINIKENRLTTRRAKTNQKIELKLKESLIGSLGEKIKNEDMIFSLLNTSGNSISDNGINKCLKNWVERAKIDKHITFYCARHTFATQLLQYGANLKTVADAMGHANTRNTIKYLNYIDNLKDDAVDNLPDLKF
ncbi:site-specific integrase [Psychroserpens burtonensis]|uniref:site-specific integrase n=1 Tax=Psychroserpens burtonensis TaxID=49278 RepID=UPI0003FB8F5B|nr:site-specific integrase [Psychroserpens burtonensis]